MKVAISNRIGAHKTTAAGKWPVAHDPLLKTLGEAASRAARQQRSILASFTYPVEWDDPLRVFTGAAGYFAQSVRDSTSSGDC